MGLKRAARIVAAVAGLGVAAVSCAQQPAVPGLLPQPICSVRPSVRPTLPPSPTVPVVSGSPTPIESTRPQPSVTPSPVETC